MSTPKKKQDKPMPPALVTLAARIEERAKIEAVDIYERIAGSLNNIKTRTGATNAVLREVVEVMDDNIPSVSTNQVLIEFAQQEIINKILKEEKQNEQL